MELFFTTEINFCYCRGKKVLLGTGTEFEVLVPKKNVNGTQPKFQPQRVKSVLPQNQKRGKIKRGKHGGPMASTVASQLEGTGLKPGRPGPFCGACMFSPCVGGFCPGGLVFPTTKNMCGERLAS